MIRHAKASDAEAICNIYNHYVENSIITFEETPITAVEMAVRIANLTQNFPFLVFVDSEIVVGYTYAAKWKERSAYRYSVETGIYIDSQHVGQGIGTKLKAAILEELKKKSIHSVLCGIALPNPTSIALCEKFGFEKVAQLREVGYKFGQWIDVGYWELIL